MFIFSGGHSIKDNSYYKFFYAFWGEELGAAIALPFESNC